MQMQRAKNMLKYTLQFITTLKQKKTLNIRLHFCFSYYPAKQKY